MEPLRPLVEFEDYSHHFGARLYPHVGTLTLIGVIAIIAFGPLDFLLTNDAGTLWLMWALRLTAAFLLLAAGLALKQSSGGWGPARLTLYGGITSFVLLATNYTVLTDHLELVAFAMVFYFFGVHALAPLLKLGDFLLASFLALVAVGGLMSIPARELSDFAVAALFAIPLQVFLGIALMASRRSHEEQYELARQIFFLSALDTMTQLLNRGTWYERAGRRFEQRAETGGRVSFLMLDIDHFKSFNDTWGHDCGDLVIREVATRLIANTRDGDLVGRLGGEEFGVLLPDTDLDGAIEVAERIRGSVEATSMVYLGKSLTVTASLGAASSLPADANLDALVKRGDEALYQAKRLGRNRVSSLAYRDCRS